MSQNKYRVHKVIEAVKNKLIADYDYSDNDCFYDSSNFKGGEEIKETLKKSIENCDYFFRFTSKNYKDSAWCTFESGIASLHNDILIIDIIVEDGCLNDSKRNIYFLFSDEMLINKMIERIIIDKNKFSGITGNNIIDVNSTKKCNEDECNKCWYISFTSNKCLSSITILLGFYLNVEITNPQDWNKYIKDNIDSIVFSSKSPVFETKIEKFLIYSSRSADIWFGKKIEIASNKIKEPNSLYIFKSGDPLDSSNWEKHELNWES